MTQFVQKRQFPRCELKTEVGVFAAGHFAFATSQDIGEGGIQILVSNDISVNDEIQLYFAIPDRGKINALAQVVYSRPSSVLNTQYIGVRFIEIKDQSRQMIREFVAQILNS